VDGAPRCVSRRKSDDKAKLDADDRHALCALRSTVKYFVRNGSTVNVAALDISKD